MISPQPPHPLSPFPLLLCSLVVVGAKKKTTRN
jgi:hypothetical protein